MHMIKENSQNSVYIYIHTLGIPRCIVLKKNGLHPFHFQRVQQLLARDKIQRINFCAGIFIFYSSFSFIFIVFLTYSNH